MAKGQITHKNRGNTVLETEPEFSRPCESHIIIPAASAMQARKPLPVTHFTSEVPSSCSVTVEDDEGLRDRNLRLQAPPSRRVPRRPVSAARRQARRVETRIYSTQLHHLVGDSARPSDQNRRRQLAQFR